MIVSPFEVGMNLSGQVVMRYDASDNWSSVLDGRIGRNWRGWPRAAVSGVGPWVGLGLGGGGGLWSKVWIFHGPPFHFPLSRVPTDSLDVGCDVIAVEIWWWIETVAA